MAGTATTEQSAPGRGVSFELTQALLSAGGVYQVRRRRDDAVAFTIRGVSGAATPAYRLVEGDSGPERGVLSGNFIKTEYEIREGSRVLGRLVFPAVAFKKTLTLRVGDAVYEADGGVFRGIFQCRNESGDVALEIAKELSIRDTFSVRAVEALPWQVGLLAAVAIHSRFYATV
jgi:uncharacterized protein YxjI